MTGRPRHPSALERQHGQATVELALAMPVVMLAVLAVLQVGLVVRDQVRVQHAAREGARVAAVDPARSAARTAALGASGLDPARTSVAPRGRDGPGSAGRRVSRPSMGMAS